MKDKIMDVLAILLTGIAIAIGIAIIIIERQPDKVIVQKWTDPDNGKVYIICTDYIIPEE